MVTVAQSLPVPLHLPALREMFEARKRVFVDLLKWDVPVLDGRYEIDQFDDEHATYLIVPDERGRPFRIGEAAQDDAAPYPRQPCSRSFAPTPPPSGPDVLEITRFCLGRQLGAEARLETRNRLVSALVGYALDHGIRTYTGVAEMGWLQQILAFGWRCRPLGLPRMVEGKMLGALRIDISPETPGLLEANGIYRSTPLRRLELLEAA